MFQIFILFLLFSCLLASSGQDDEVLILPGLRIQPTFKHYSGYLSGSNTRLLHYWLVESQNSPSRDPLVLWLNGGPGCSSLSGLITENGPFSVTNASYLIYNPYSWNKIANVIYLESPACVGFSYSTDGNCEASDDSTSILNYNALQHFLIKFPQYKNRDFYITGESYAGFYIPVLSERIISTKPGLALNFKGIAVGNGLSSLSVNYNGNFHFAYNHGLISDSLWSEILAVCCRGKDDNHCDITGNTDSICQAKIEHALTSLGKLNPYNIYSECYTTDNPSEKEMWSVLNVKSNYEKFQILFGWNENFLTRVSELRQRFQYLNSVYKIMNIKNPVTMNVPCTDDTPSINFLNNPKVRYALHIPLSVQPWSACSGPVFLNYKKNFENMKNQYHSLFNLTKFRIWIYNGDIDMVCSYLADEWFFQAFNQSIISSRKPWFYKEADNSSQIGGFVKIFQKFVLLTVRGAGHMVPTDKPIPAYYMFQAFLNGNSL